MGRHQFIEDPHAVELGQRLQRYRLQFGNRLGRAPGQPQQARPDDQVVGTGAGTLAQSGQLLFVAFQFLERLGTLAQDGVSLNDGQTRVELRARISLQRRVGQDLLGELERRPCRGGSLGVGRRRRLVLQLLGAEHFGSRTVAKAANGVPHRAQPHEQFPSLLGQRQCALRPSHQNERRGEVAQDSRPEQIVVGRRRQALVQAQCPLEALDRLGECEHVGVGVAQGRQMVRLEVRAPDRLRHADGPVKLHDSVHRPLQAHVAVTDEPCQARLEVEPVLPAQLPKGCLRLLTRGHRIGAREVQ